MYFNPLPSSEGRLPCVCPLFVSLLLQSTSLIRGKTFLNGFFVIVLYNFNPLPSSEGRRRTASFRKFSPTSIHFPHPREDPSGTVFQKPISTSIHFPHPREDIQLLGLTSRKLYFNPLPSSEGRHPIASLPSSSAYFNPLPSSEGRRRKLERRKAGRTLQSTSLIRGKTILLL